MSLLQIDLARCTKCGLCATVCPSCIIERPDGERPPRVEAAREASCIRCGHCMAFCPTDALTRRLAPEELPRRDGPAPQPVAPAPLAWHMQLRRSIRHWKPEPVDRATIDRIMDAVRYAPSAVNRQVLQWLLVHDPAEVHRLAGSIVDWLRKPDESGAVFRSPAQVKAMVDAWERGSDPIFRGAPHLVVAHAPPDAPWAPTDAAIALSYFDVLAPAFGVGTCWAGLFLRAAPACKELQTALALPAGRVVASGMFFGYPKYRALRCPPRNALQIVWR